MNEIPNAMNEIGGKLLNIYRSLCRHHWIELLYCQVGNILGPGISSLDWHPESFGVRGILYHCRLTLPFSLSVSYKIYLVKISYYRRNFQSVFIFHSPGGMLWSLQWEWLWKIPLEQQFHRAYSRWQEQTSQCYTSSILL